MAEEERRAAIARIEAAIKQGNEEKEIHSKSLQEYNDLEQLLTDLPKKLTHDILCPIGPMAFFQGKIKHTNEITTLIGDDYFLERTAANSIKTINTRQTVLTDKINEIDKHLHKCNQIYKQATGTQDDAVTTTPTPNRQKADAPEGCQAEWDTDGFLEIREPEDFDDAPKPKPAGEAYGSRFATKDKKEGGKESWPLFERLKEMELEEEEAEKTTKTEKDITDVAPTTKSGSVKVSLTPDSVFKTGVTEKNTGGLTDVTNTPAADPPKKVSRFKQQRHGQI